MAGEMHGAFSSMAAVWTSAADVGHDNSGPPSRAAHKMADNTVCFIKHASFHNDDRASDLIVWYKADFYAVLF
jgi:hypothetical protein